MNKVAIAFVANTDTYEKLKAQIPRNKFDITKPDVTGIIAEVWNGLPLHKKANQKEGLYAFYDQELLDMYLNDALDESFFKREALIDHDQTLADL